MLYQGILAGIVDQSRKIFGEELTGIYLHGSMAMGCFNPDKSDIDLIWTPTSGSITFPSLMYEKEKSHCQMANHFEFHQSEFPVYYRL